jgi:hypothetical protein
MIQAIERLLPFINAGTAVVPGHGAIAMISSIFTTRFIEGRVQRLIAAGSSVAEERFLVAKCGIKARTIDAHSLG